MSGRPAPSRANARSEVKTPHRYPIQIPLPLVDKPTAKLDPRRRPELAAVLAELLLLAVRSAPEGPSVDKAVTDEAS